MLSSKDRQYILDTIDIEGFDYAFMHYSDFADIKDTEFHQLRAAYRSAYVALAEYVGVE